MKNSSGYQTQDDSSVSRVSESIASVSSEQYYEGQREERSEEGMKTHGSLFYEGLLQTSRTCTRCHEMTSTPWC